MQTKLIPLYDKTPMGKKAEEILRTCVHCGFCNATCPTYQVLGDELDGPRGRIYLIKQILEGKSVGALAQQHLDRCLTCRSCETTCPSGVRYHELLEIGRKLALENVPRSRVERFKRSTLMVLLGSPRFFAFMLRLGRLFRPFMPSSLKSKVPMSSRMSLGIAEGGESDLSGRSDFESAETTDIADTTVLLLEGCVQNTMAPEINQATKLVLGRLGIQVLSIPENQCCGAMQQHLDQADQARDRVKVNIDAWLETAEQEGAEYIVVNASGCGVFAKDYPELFLDDPHYQEKAQRLSGMVVDPVELLGREDILSALTAILAGAKPNEVLAFHPPCTLQHGQQLSGSVEAMFAKLGIALRVPTNSHLCCGSAGTYSITQPTLSNELKQRKLASIDDLKPDLILTANIGCQSHLASDSDIPVVHWIQLLAKLLTNYTKL